MNLKPEFTLYEITAHKIFKEMMIQAMKASASTADQAICILPFCQHTLIPKMQYVRNVLEYDLYQ